MKLAMLVNSAYRPEAPLTPYAYTLREEAGGIATATLTLPPAPLVEVGRYLRLWNGCGEDVGLFRVTRTVMETAHGGLQRVEAEHCLAALCDCVLPSTVLVGNTVSRAVTDLLRYGGAPMTLGTAERDASCRLTFSRLTVWEAVSAALAELPAGWRLEVDTSDSPWLLHIRAAENTPCLLSPVRNLCGLNFETDLTDYCSRLYAIGKDGLTVNTVNSGSPWVQAEASPKWGVASRLFIRADVDSASTLKALAVAELGRHNTPVVSVRATARVLSAETGEQIDRFSLGRLCVVPASRLPGTWLEELRCRVVTRLWPDLVRDPQDVVLTLANRRARLSALVPVTSAARSSTYLY